MDRRTILAFILIGLIIYFMPIYMKMIGNKPEKHLTDNLKVDKESEILSSPNLWEEKKNFSKLKPVVSTQNSTVDFDIVNIVVETDLYQATFTNNGGKLVSWKLKNFLDPFGHWVELLGPGGSGLGLSLSNKPLNSIQFIPDKVNLFLSGSEQGVLTLSGMTEFGPIEKKIRFQGDRYRMELSLSMPENIGNPNLGIIWTGGLADTEGSLGEDAGFYSSDYNQIVTYSGGEIEFWNVERINGEERPPSGQVSWVGVRNKYFLATIIPPEGRHEIHLQGKIEATGAKNFITEIVTELGQFQLNWGIYIGPISYEILRRQNIDLFGRNQEHQLDEFLDYGWEFFKPIMKPMTILTLKAFLTIRKLVSNYGVVIVIFSIFAKILVFPLTHKSLESASKMQQLQPKIAALREMYPDDQQKFSKAQMKLYKDEKINPLGGCLPMIVQMPILISLFNVFRSSIELRQAEFIFWIDDLSKPDKIALGNFEIHILPLLMAGSMFLQQKMTIKDPKQVALVYIMPIFMTYIFWSMSSGLVLYWTLFNVLTMLQQQLMPKNEKGPSLT